MQATFSNRYQYWQKKQTGEVFAVKFRGGRPQRFCGPLEDREYKAHDGKLLRLKLEVFHYGFKFEDDPFNYLICDV